LRGEKVDVVQWRDDTGQFIAEALGPAKVKEVHIDEETKTADVVVSEHQLSLAIGKEGQNARLAARLSGYKVDIRSDNEGVVEEAAVEVATEEVATEEVVTEETPAGEAVTAETAPEEVTEEVAETAPEEVTEEVTETVEAVELSETGSDDEDAVVTADEDEESE
jgi:N utilization substance protein A